MKIFLDDIRMPLDCMKYMKSRIGGHVALYTETWHVVRDYDSFVKIVSENIDKITHISFDHDLSDEHYVDYSRADAELNYHEYKERTGLECAKFVNHLYTTQNKDLPVLFVHSMNGVGTKNIIEEFKRKRYEP